MFKKQHYITDLPCRKIRHLTFLKPQTTPRKKTTAYISTILRYSMKSSRNHSSPWFCWQLPEPASFSHSWREFYQTGAELNQDSWQQKWFHQLGLQDRTVQELKQRREITAENHTESWQNTTLTAWACTWWL